jgi:hypothetical protein
MYLTVQDPSGSRIYQGMPSYSGGNPRIFEDGKGRLWLLSFSGGPSVKLFPINADFTLGAGTDLSAGFSGHPYDGFGHMAVTRGGTAIGNAISGFYPNGSSIVAWRIRLPD